MTKPLVVFPDAAAAGAAVLRSALAGRPEDYATEVTVGTRVPGNRSPEAPHLPFVQVSKDTDIPQWPVNTRVTLRITVWHTSADKAHDLAQLAQGLLLVHCGSVLRSVRAATGPLPAIDPDSGVEMSTFTVLANLRPTLVAP